MLCPRCYGTHVVLVNGQPIPCPECGGIGEIHCCDGLTEQPEPGGAIENVGDARGETPPAKGCAVPRPPVGRPDSKNAA